MNFPSEIERTTFRRRIIRENKNRKYEKWRKCTITFVIYIFVLCMQIIVWNTHIRGKTRLTRPVNCGLFVCYSSYSWRTETDGENEKLRQQNERRKCTHQPEFIMLPSNRAYMTGLKSWVWYTRILRYFPVLGKWKPVLDWLRSYSWPYWSKHITVFIFSRGRSGKKAECLTHVFLSCFNIITFHWKSWFACDAISASTWVSSLISKLLFL